MAERTIKILSFNYSDAEGNWRTAWQGQSVELSEEDIARGEEAGAFVTEEVAADEAGAISLESTDEELEAFVKDAKISKVVEAAGQDAEFAKRLLEAENAATGNDPRKGVVAGLAQIVGD
jgi:hypothetical protein